MLRELAELTTLDEANPQSFRVRAYESAAQAIAAQATDLGRLTAQELQQIQGIGKSTADKIRELLETGQRREARGAAREAPAQRRRAAAHPGARAEGARASCAASSASSRSTTCARRSPSTSVRGLAGFGAKSEEKLAARARAARRAGLRSSRTPISVALPLATRIVERMLEVPGVVARRRTAARCAASRRRSATSTSSSPRAIPAPVMEALVSMQRRRARARPRRVEDQRRHAPRHAGRSARRRRAPARRRAALLHGLEGPQHQAPPARARARAHAERVRALRESRAAASSRARPRSRSTRRSASPWIPPVLREDAGEIEAAERGALPAADRRDDRRLPRAHARSRATAARRSRRWSPRRARAASACSRSPITPRARSRASGARRCSSSARRSARCRPQLGDSLRLLHGVELNIGPNGELDYDAEFRSGFDWCLASVHDHFELDRAAQTRRVVTAMRDPSVRMIGHLSARMIGGRPPIELDLDAIFAAAEATGTALEMNGALPRLDLSVDALRRARDARRHVRADERRAPRARARARAATRRATRSAPGSPPERVARKRGRRSACARGRGRSAHPARARLETHSRALSHRTGYPAERAAPVG